MISDGDIGFYKHFQQPIPQELTHVVINTSMAL